MIDSFIFPDPVQLQSTAFLKALPNYFEEGDACYLNLNNKSDLERSIETSVYFIFFK